MERMDGDMTLFTQPQPYPRTFKAVAAAVAVIMHNAAMAWFAFAPIVDTLDPTVLFAEWVTGVLAVVSALGVASMINPFPWRLPLDTLAYGLTAVNTGMVMLAFLILDTRSSVTFQVLTVLWLSAGWWMSLSGHGEATASLRQGWREREGDGG